MCEFWSQVILVKVHFFRDQISGEISQEQWASSHVPRVVFF